MARKPFSIESTRLNRVESVRSSPSNRVNRIESIGSSQSDWGDRIELIGSSRFDWEWLPGRILSCLDLNWVQIGPKMAKMAIFGPIFDRIDSIGSIRLTWSDQIFWKYRVFLKIPCIHENHEFRDYFRTCFAKFPRIRKYQIYTGLNSNMEKNVSSLAKMENPEKNSFRIALQ